jgi:16S rRNA processing protein RimM
VNDAVADHLAVGQPVRIGSADTVIVGRKGTDAHPLVRVDLASDRDGAEALRGQQLLVDAERELDEDEYLAADLVGCAVVDGSRSLGTVTALLELPSVEVLELDTGLLVPMVSDAIRSIDVAAKRIDVDAEFLGAG